ncbi:TlpA family protein disulfide reductase [Bradyrhizobium sp. CCBAU 53380]|uniref:TlpA family protein disulfide reductase n=1 Tax=Bradyrhizobium sp. CCBAU 53380 TaxID=1325117 RepID=UPI002FE04D23
MTEKLPKLNCQIGFNYTGEMDKLLIHSSFSVGIPTSFVVDRDGRIAFIGCPRQLDDVLPNSPNGSFRISDEAKAFDAERIAKGERTMPIFSKLTPAVKAQERAKALLVVEEAVAVLPDDANFRVFPADLLLLKMHDLQASLPVMSQLVRDAINKKSALWMAGAMRQLFDPANDNSHLPHAERVAMGNELSEHILAVDPPQRGEALKFLSYPAVAQYYYECGNKDRAIELIEVTLKSLDGPVPTPDKTETAGYVGIGPNAGQLQGSEGLLWVSSCDSANSPAKTKAQAQGEKRMNKRVTPIPPTWLRQPRIAQGWPMSQIDALSPRSSQIARRFS